VLAICTHYPEVVQGGLSRETASCLESLCFMAAFVSLEHFDVSQGYRRRVACEICQSRCCTIFLEYVSASQSAQRIQILITRLSLFENTNWTHS